ncbi:hypothetical protein CRG49_008145 [Neisseria sp. N95_16]|uniref:Uncharacterized protein n=1 Tax=Neisseria brasiliensis TaxID=2666100 RepID=A0A5Q3S398_9NEIS|nr:MULTISPECIES: hypothetical protein [Neisseria]MRN38243.1 hypothetical protein [Neisseria brasiliensis]PJO09328.1 hypothetical protein CRG49_008145 [Neisseria sp. N95_16]PJO78116.1 hypothetical protein CWC45_06950 [Neisseria sp. N177_16]QGL25238.1 hypothetical protein GJV52_06650 [Neisseria brasiliensis]
MMTKTVKRFVGIGVIGITAAVGLSGCVVSDDPAVNAIATTATVGTVASLLYYSLDDGYYYDKRYNRMPRSYRPAYNTHVRRIDSMSDYRRRYPLEARMHQQNRVLSDRVYRQREQNRMLENRLEQQRVHNRQLQQRVEDSRNRSILTRDRMEQQRRSQQVREHVHQQRTANQQQRIYRSNESRLLNRQSNTQNRQMPVRSPRSNSLRAPWEQYGS